MSEYTCSVCGKSLEYGGRGRPPTKCDEHKASASAPAASAPRKRPGAAETPATPSPRPRPSATAKDTEHTNSEEAPRARPRPNLAPPVVGTPDTKSRSKAEGAHNRMVDQVEAANPAWPLTSDGRPMSRIEMAASELVPTGQYANVSVGPARITMFVDLNRETNGSFFSEQERANMVKSLNELAEVVEHDVIAVQRSIVLDSMQDQLAADK